MFPDGVVAGHENNVAPHQPLNHLDEMNAPAPGIRGASDAEFTGGVVIAFRCNSHRLPNNIQPGDYDEISVDWCSRDRRGSYRNSRLGTGRWRLLSRLAKRERRALESHGLVRGVPLSRRTESKQLITKRFGSGLDASASQAWALGRRRVHRSRDTESIRLANVWPMLSDSGQPV